ncbi:hypothetical protein LSH36_97g01005 [Paralvinella palmiformis]|uniref:Uncharacterized protein n=1 Tax=Paralvinella palmiformis TaxID=53620 RepID=A0AAD9NBH6_9ANNE|nr:hypothetical protein LSH36_97g01005 [Paralvinella palmiformis]
MTGYGVGFPKGSKWIDRVNHHLSQYQYDGYMERLQKFWLAGACKKGSEEGEMSMPLGILNFTSAFILLAGGILSFYFLIYTQSMGKSLTFEQSVREAIELQKHFKCKNPICETQVWKLKHELDLALLRIERLQKQASERGISYDKRAVWKETTGSKPVSDHAAPSIGWKRDALQLPGATYGERSKTRIGDGSPDPATRVRSQGSSCRDCSQPHRQSDATRDDDDYYYYYPAAECHPSSAKARTGVPRTVPRTDAAFPPPSSAAAAAPPTYKEPSAPPAAGLVAGPTLISQGTPIAARSGRPDEKNAKGSKSLPSSPIKRPVAGPSSLMENTVVPYGQRSLEHGTLSSHDLRTRDSKYQTNRIPLARGQRYGKCEGTVEKETVL